MEAPNPQTLAAQTQRRNGRETLGAMEQKLRSGFPDLVWRANQMGVDVAKDLAEWIQVCESGVVADWVDIESWGSKSLLVHETSLRTEHPCLVGLSKRPSCPLECRKSLPTFGSTASRTKSCFSKLETMCHRQLLTRRSKRPGSAAQCFRGRFRCLACT